MTEGEFIDALSVHYPPRHDDDTAAAQWLQAMLEGVRGYPEYARTGALKKILKTRLLRSFPLLAEICKALEAELPPPLIGHGTFRGPCRSMPRTPEELERTRQAAEWQKQMADKYGTFDKYLLATVNRRSDGAMGQKMAAKSTSFSTLSDISKRITGEST